MIASEKLEAGLQAMERRAKELGLKRGVGSILVDPPTGHPYAAFFFLDAIVRAPDPANRGVGDKGTNYFGVVMSKVAFSISTRMDSGALAALKFGEVEFRGSLILPQSDGSLVYFAFSGGTEDQDVDIANVGISAFEGSTS